MSADFGTAIFRATIPASISPTGSSFTIDQTYTIAKSKAGVDGSAGAAVNLAFIRKATTPTATGSGSLPSGETNPSWTDEVPA